MCACALRWPIQAITGIAMVLMIIWPVLAAREAHQVQNTSSCLHFTHTFNLTPKGENESTVMTSHLSIAVTRPTGLVTFVLKNAKPTGPSVTKKQIGGLN